MDCIYCGGKTRTTNSRSTSKGLQVWRRRACTDCKAVFTTNEATLLDQAIRVNGEGDLEPFWRLKLHLSIYRSISHRKSAHGDAEQLVRTILAELLPAQRGVVDRSDLKHTTQNVLKQFDTAASVHYEAHHR